MKIKCKKCGHEFAGLSELVSSAKGWDCPNCAANIKESGRVSCKVKCPACNSEQTASSEYGRFTCPCCNEEFFIGKGPLVECPALPNMPFNPPEAEPKEQASTGAVRSKLYPHGAKFPARYDLMFRNAVGMRRLAETWGEGFAKYGADNWMMGFPESVFISHLLEHQRLYLAGDTSEDHMAHIAWNALALAWIQENKPELLDLTKPEQKA